MTPGIPELLVVLLIVLVLLGPKRLPALGRQLGGGLRELRSGLRGRGDDAAGPAAPRADEDEVLEGEVVPERRR